MQIFARSGRWAVASAWVTALAACASPSQADHGQGGGRVAGNPNGYQVSTENPAWGQRGAPVQQGQVVAIEMVQVQDPNAVSAGGALVGGVVGGVLGNQVGKGRGRTLATIAGAVGGAIVGNAVQNSMGGSVRDLYRVTIQLRDGNVQVFDYPQPPPFDIGDQVRINGDQVYR